jgi:hypothetical protein
MEGNAWFAPLYATVVAGAFLATAVTRPSGVARGATFGGWAALFLLGAAFVAAKLGMVRVWEAMLTLLGASAFLGATWFTWRGSRAKNGAHILSRVQGMGLHDATTHLAGGASTDYGVFDARLAADAPVTSPGGVLCAAYRTELRPTGDAKSRVVSEEGAAQHLWAIDAETRVSMPRVTALLMGPAEQRSSRMASTVDLLEGQACINGLPPVDAMCTEHVARMGQSCRIVGRLVRDSSGVVLRGDWDRPALLVVGEVTEAINRIKDYARMCFLRALGLCALAAFILAQGS